MHSPDCITVDFETDAIDDRPNYPPAPVGVAIKWPGEPAVYFGWGHTSGNTCTFQAGIAELERVWAGGLPVLCHNAKFDLAVATEKLKLPVLPWQRVHDTMFLAFLAKPHALKLGLKDLAADLLSPPVDDMQAWQAFAADSPKWLPAEQDELHDWIWTHRHELETTYGRKVKKSELGGWIAQAPGDLVGRYAVGDVDRTFALYERLWPEVQAAGMGEAYDRERRLLPILMENERIGMRVDMARLERDVTEARYDMATAEGWLCQELGTDLNLDADRQVADALLENGIVPKENWQLTESGQLCVKKDVLLPAHFSGPNGAQVASALGYRNRLKTCLTMFMEPWLEQAMQRRGYISTNWNQTRGTGGGTRTGRPSTNNPNFLNISKTWDNRGDGYMHPGHLEVAPLPHVRKYILPDEGHVWIDIDFSGQELRVFADFSRGLLREQYMRNPKLDPHQYVADRIAELTGDPVWSTKERRTLVKNVNFGKLYGAGFKRLTEQLKGDAAAARSLSDLHARAMPDLPIANKVIKTIAQRGDPVRTWGGRVYYPEPAKVVDGQRRDFVYKLINYITQGGAADLTKQVINDWSDDPRCKSRFMVQVYDEICISAPAHLAREQLLLLKEHMEAPRLDVPMIADASWGPNWHDIKEFKE